MNTRVLFLVCFLFLLGPSLWSQESKIVEAFGIDILPAFIALGGGTAAYDEVELIYRANNENGQQLRLKLNVNNRAVITNEVVFSEALNSACGNVIPQMSSNYQPTRNIHVSTGLAKYITNSNFPLYYGLDLNLGVFRGRVESVHEICGVNDTIIVETVGEQNAFSYMVGLTPVLGTELTLNRLTLIIEFGFSANYNFGNHPFFDEELNEQELRFSRSDFVLNKFVNDFAIVYRF